MNIQQLKETLPYLKLAGLCPNVIGLHGIGKSAVVKQFALENGYTYHPFFLSQMNDIGDLLGLPEFDRDKNGKATSVSFVHPAKLPKKPKAILHFDELNRATKDLIQAIFQLALEGTVHDYTLPEDSMVVFSMNPATDDYSVLDFGDKAFSDRFVHINLDPTAAEFHKYINKKHGASGASVSGFLTQQTKLLEEQDLKAVSLDFVKPSRRSWDRLIELEKTGIPQNLFRECGMGIVGTAAMVAYASYLETQVKVLDGKDILDNFAKVKNTFVGYFQNPKTGEAIEVPRTDIISTVCQSFTEELTARLKDDSLTEKNAKNTLDFLMTAPIENAYAALLPLKVVSEFSTNKHLTTHLLENNDLRMRLREARKAKLNYQKQQGQTLSEEEEKILNS